MGVPSCSFFNSLHFKEGPPGTTLKAAPTAYALEASLGSFCVPIFMNSYACPPISLDRSKAVKSRLLVSYIPIVFDMYGVYHMVSLLTTPLAYLDTVDRSRKPARHLLSVLPLIGLGSIANLSKLFTVLVHVALEPPHHASSSYCSIS
jgi:hypothetical protein